MHHGQRSFDFSNCKGFQSHVHQAFFACHFSSSSNAALSHIANAILDHQAAQQDIRAMAARYVMLAKCDDGAPVDPVARLHSGNGARLAFTPMQTPGEPSGTVQRGNGQLPL